MESKQRSQIKVGALLSYIIVGINILIGFIYTPIIIRTLGQAEYGLYSLVYSFMSYLTILDFGLGNAIIVYTSKAIAKKNKEEEYKLNGILFIVYCIIGLITFILGIILFLNIESVFSKTMSSYEYNEAKKMIIIFTLNIAITFPLSVFSNIILAYEKFIFNKMVKILQIVTAPIITLPLLMIYPKAWVIVAILAITNIISLLFNVVYAFVKLKFKISFRKLDFGILKEIFGYSFYVFLQVVVDRINWSVDQVILGATSGTVSVAVYAVGAKINHLYNTLSSALSGVTLPRIAKMEEEKRDISEFLKIIIKTGRLQFMILALTLTGFIIFGKTFIAFWAGKEYTESYYIAIILMLGGLIPLTQNVAMGVVQAKNKHKIRTVIICLIAILNITVTIPMAKVWGGIGAAFGTFGALVLGQGLIINIYYHKYIGLNMKKFFREILKILIPVLIIATPSYFIYKELIPHNMIYLALSIAAYTIIYIITIWGFVLNKEEKNQFNKILIQLKLKKEKFN